MNDQKDAGKSFRTYANYVEAFAYVCDREYGEYPEDFAWGVGTEATIVAPLIRTIRTHQAYPKLERRGAPGDLSAIKRSLTNAWATEAVLAVLHESVPDDALPISAQWAVVQAYYVTYQATRAVALATNSASELQSHTTVQRFFENHWTQGSMRLSPFCLRYSGAEGLTNSPRLEGTSVHNLGTVTRDNCYEFVELALRTTFNHALDEELKSERRRKARAKRNGWEREEQARVARGHKPRKRPEFAASSRLSKDETQRRRDALRPVTLIDFLYRLRIGANYVDASVYTEAAAVELGAWSFLNHLRLLVSVVLAASEAQVRARIGEGEFDRLASGWAGKTKARPAQGTILMRAGMHRSSTESV